jgi:hypothetical protein
MSSQVVVDKAIYSASEDDLDIVICHIHILLGARHAKMHC